MVHVTYCYKINTYRNIDYLPAVYFQLNQENQNNYNLEIQERVQNLRVCTLYTLFNTYKLILV